MKIIYIESICNDEAGEVEGAFDEDGTLLGLWAANDGNWRREYFNGFMKKIGIDVKRGKFEDKLEAEAVELFGLN